MSGTEETPTVTVGEDGNAVKCAMDGQDCEYKSGDKVCGKCGAAAVSAPEEEMEEDASTKADTCSCGVDSEVGEDGTCTKCGKPMKLEKKDSEDAAAEVEEKAADDDEEISLNEKQIEVLDLRSKHLAQLRGDVEVKTGEEDSATKDGYLCADERKVLDLDAEPCAGCAGGCQGAKGYPDLLMVEAIAAKTLGGEVVDSGYSELTDLYLVDLRVKSESGDDEFVQAIYSGAGKMKGWLALDEMVEAKSDQIGVQAAIDAALVEVKGEALSISADTVDGIDVFNVEVDGIDGKSYDVFVSLDGTVVGWDEFDYKTEEEDAKTPESSETQVKGEESETEIASAIEGDEAAILASIMEFEALAAEIESEI